MCTRFYYDNSISVLKEYEEAASKSKLMNHFAEVMSKPLLKNAEVRPTDVVPVLAPNKDGKQTVFPMLWGFTISLPKEPNLGNNGWLCINARVETAPKKKTFAESWQRRRCIIPCAYYYEWRHEKNPSNGKDVPKEKYMIQPAGMEITYLAGLYRVENGYPVFTVLTTDPPEELLGIHDRMPVIMPEEAVNDWINPSSNPMAVLPKHITEMYFEQIS